MRQWSYNHFLSICSMIFLHIIFNHESHVTSPTHSILSLFPKRKKNTKIIYCWMPLYMYIWPIKDQCRCVARILWKYWRVRVGSFKYSVFLENPTRLRQHFGEFAQHSSEHFVSFLIMCVKDYSRSVLFPKNVKI